MVRKIIQCQIYSLQFIHKREENLFQFWSTILIYLSFLLVKELREPTSAPMSLNIENQLSWGIWHCKILVAFYLPAAVPVFTCTLWNFLRKLEMELPFDPAIPLLELYPNYPETPIQKNLCTPMFRAENLQ